MISHPSLRCMFCPSSSANQNARRNCAADLEFVVDGSRSVEVLGRGNFRKVLEFIKNVTKDLNISPQGIRVGVVVYGTEPELAISINKFTTSDTLSLALDRVPYPATAKMTGKALDFARRALFDTGSRPKFPKILVVLTEGTSKDSVLESSADLHKRGVHVISVGLGPIHDPQELSDMASLPPAENVVISRFPELQYKFSDLQNRICQVALSNIKIR